MLTDDIFDKITAWEDDVQSVDMVSMQKLWLSIHSSIIINKFYSKDNLMFNFFASCGLCSNVPASGDYAYEVFKKLPPAPERV